MDLIRYYKNLNRGDWVKLEDLTDAQIEDYLYKYKQKEYDQQSKCNEEYEKFVRNSRRQKQMKIGG